MATIQLGASDYLLKDRLARLGQAVTRAIREKKLSEEKRRAEEQLQRQVQRLAALRSIDMTITASFDIRVTLATLADHLLTQLNVDAANILRLNARSLMLEFVTGRGFRHSTGSELPQRVGQAWPDGLYSSNRWSMCRPGRAAAQVAMVCMRRRILPAITASAGRQRANEGRAANIQPAVDRAGR